MIYCFCGSYDFFSTWHSSLALRKRTQKKSNGVGWWGGVMVRADGRHVALTSALLEHDGRRSTTKEPLLDGLFPLPSLGFPTGLLMAIDDGCRERIDGVAIVSAHRNATHFAPPPPPIQIVAPIRAASKSVSCPLKVTGLSIHNPRSGLFPIVDCHKALIKVTKTTQCTNPPSRMRFRTNPIICQKSVRVISFSLPISVIH